MDRNLNIGVVHYSCAPFVGGVEEVINQHTSLLHRMGQSVRLLAGMGEVYREDFPVRIEPLLGSKNSSISKSHEQVKSGDYGPLRRLTNRIFETLAEWADGMDVILAHNVLHMPFNLPLTLAIRRMASRSKGPVIVSWAHDSPYFHPNYPPYLDDHPWNVLRKTHRNIHYVTISESRRQLFSGICGGVPWRVIHNGVDPASILYLDERSIRLAQELDLFNRDLVVVQPSRITPRKNLELSIHIVRGIKLLGYNILFVLTGAYDPHEQRAISYYRRLKYWIKELGMEENIAVLAEYRFKDRKKLVPDRVFIRDLYLMADLLLMTSRDEGFGLPLLEAGLVKLPIACSEIPPFREMGKEVCFFRLEEHPLSIAGRIVEYLARSSTHQMFRNVMRKHVLEVICKKEILPFLGEIVAQRGRP
ncbi:MAG: glycosyltransferase family 4 protein [Deltaproteobacteria bacterium]|nr:glycosyltransferase family 4 protein [Deltaproteobacteria bacterium]MBW2136228.1 glycosyltransferase family 4 protein [Deltaproteobacteria bacterium]